MFTILIPTWNNLAHLRLAVESIRTHSAEPHQIVVHVNDGSDGSLAWVRGAGHRVHGIGDEHRHLAAAAWISRIEGSYTGIMGLPLHETVTLLRWAGVAAASP